MAADPTQGTGLLFRLPAELRNQIYGVAFSINSGDGGSLDLLATSIPNKGLLLTCKAIYHEARSMYTLKHRLFWSQTTFAITDDKRRIRKDALDKFSMEDLNHIRSCQALFIPSSRWAGEPTKYTYRGGNEWLREEFADHIKAPATKTEELRLFVKDDGASMKIYRNKPSRPGPNDTHPATVGEALTSMIQVYGINGRLGTAR